jgi:ubiquinone/menaquinone biosynthesis C-methylase UbiE
MTKEQATYSHGHHKSVVEDHARRSAKDSAGYLIPYIKPTDIILDVGCGPGTITADLAALATQGKVVGCDAVESVLQQGIEHATSRGLTNVTFQKADANTLPFDDNTFDIVHCHQVLQHVKNPVVILKEMRRVVKPGGIVAAREADYKTFAWYPEPPEIARWMELYQKVARANGGEPNAGRYCHVWAREAGFELETINATWDVWRYSGVRAQQFSRSWSGRILQPGFLETAEREKFATNNEIQNISKAWEHWGDHEQAFIAIPHGEILCRKL